MKAKLCAGLLVLATVAGAQNDNSITISGRVVDDATSQPLVDFMVQQGFTSKNLPGEIFWQSYMVGDARAQNPGSWTVKLGFSQVAARITAPGYGPEILQRDAFTNRQTSGLEIRLKRGELIHGEVRDAGGKPVGGAKVYLTTVQQLFLTDGKIQWGVFRDNSTTTDESGRFELRGAGGPPQRIVVATADNHLFWPIVESEQRQAMEITLPKPGSLIVRYDIPGDAPEAKFDLQLYTAKMDRTLWKDISFGLSFTVANGGQTVLTNLTPGIYNLRRWKSVDFEHGAQTESQTVLIEAGQTQTVDLSRPNGQRVRGKVIGPGQVLTSGGYIYVRSVGAAGQPWPQRSRNEQNDFNFLTFDVSQFGADGTFQTASLRPGTYAVIAHVYPPNAPAGAFPYHPDYVGVTNVTVTADTLSPVTIKLAPALFVGIHGHVIDDLTGVPIRDFTIQSGKVNPDKPDEINWNEGFQGGMMGAGVSAGQFELRDEKAGAAFRFTANGYVPQIFTRDELIASRQTANLEVRLKRGGELHGVVLDHGGLPVAEATVYLAPLDLGYVRFGWVMSSGNITYWAHTFATTDHAGHFSLRGVDGSQTRVIAVTSDGQMVQPMQVHPANEELKITLPEPATLVVHYDIPGDAAKAYFDLALRTNDLAMPLWEYVNLKPTATISNGGQIVLTNLLPGTYDISRTKFGGAAGHEHAFIFGDPFKRVQFDTRKLVLESGQTQHVDLVRSAGRRVEGQVTGMESITNSAGAFLYVGPANSINSTDDFKTNNLDPCYDAVMLGTNGLFQTALLEPGNYTLVAEAYVWGKPPKREAIPDDEPQYGGIWFSPQQLAYVGSTKVTVTTTPAPPVKIELRPWVSSAKSP